jgi:hypothetical protein
MMDDEKQEWSDALKAQTVEAIKNELVSEDAIIAVKNIGGLFGVLSPVDPPTHSLMVEEHRTGNTHKFANVGELLKAGWVID